MLLLRQDILPDDQKRWAYQLKLDGYRAVAFKTGGKIYLRSRNDNDFSLRYPAIVDALAKLPDNTVIDGEVVAFDEDGRPSFNALQNYGSSAAPVVYYVFDVMVLAGQDVMREPLEKRRKLLEQKVLPKLREPVRYTGALDASLSDLIASVKSARTRGPGREAARQPVRARPAVGRVDEDARQPGTGVRDRRLHAGDQDLRCAHLRLLRGQEADLRRAHTQRFHAGESRAAVQEVPWAGDQGMPVREPAGGRRAGAGGRA